MRSNFRITILKIIYQLLMLSGWVSGFFWLQTGFDPYSRWLVGLCGIPLSLTLTFVDYFIRDVLRQKHQIGENYRC